MTAYPSQLQLPNPFGGVCFQFWNKNRPQKHQKRAILHTFQAPPVYVTDYATALSRFAAH